MKRQALALLLAATAALFAAGCRGPTRYTFAGYANACEVAQADDVADMLGYDEAPEFYVAVLDDPAVDEKCDGFTACLLITDEVAIIVLREDAPEWTFRHEVVHMVLYRYEGDGDAMHEDDAFAVASEAGPCWR